MTGPGSLRAFVAFELPDEIRERLRSEQRHLKATLPKARWTRPEGQHLTLKFLGETPVPKLHDLAGRIAETVGGLRPVTVELAGSGFFPNPRRPRVAWVGGRAEGGTEIAAAVEAAATTEGFEPQRRQWSLHLTQARLDRPWPRTAVEAFLEWGRTLDLAPFRCAEVVLFSSRLKPGGAVYTALERVPLE
jgi:2'-5' RNA ligase